MQSIESHYRRSGKMTQSRKLTIPLVSKDDRIVIDQVAQDLGYRDLSHLITHNGCDNVEEFLSDFNFTSIRDFFLGYGWFERIEPFRKNGNGKSSLNGKRSEIAHR